MGTDQTTDQTLEVLKLDFEAWKTAVQVQQHFNTIEMQVRSIAVTVLTAAIAAAGFTATVSSPVVLLLGSLVITPSTIVLLAALLAWFAFYLMDRLWYHRLLIGSVKHAASIETRLEERIKGITLGKSISEESQLTIGRWDKRSKTIGPWHVRSKTIGPWHVRSNQKIDVFYFLIAGFILVLAFGSSAIPSKSSSPSTTSVSISAPTPIVVIISTPTAPSP